MWHKSELPTLERLKCIQTKQENIESRLPKNSQALYSQVGE